MSDLYTFIGDLGNHVQIPENGILSQTLQNDDRTKVIIFGFAPGQELSAHTAPFPATLYFVKGEADLKLGPDTKTAAAGTFVYMTPNLEHGIRARTDVVMLLTMVKNRP
jgi:quercetin dioxygenase-like cupin family protein